jgi:hypothetical protein
MGRSAGHAFNLIDGGAAPVYGISRYDDIAAGKEGGAEIYESGSDADWRFQHDFQGVATLPDE